MRRNDSNRTLALAAVLAAAWLSTTPAGAIDVPVVTADDIGWRHPQASDDHRFVVMERFRNNGCIPGPTCPFPRFHDVGVLDLGATCAQDVLRLVTSDGVSHDPSVSADGTLVAFWREEATAGSSIVVQPLDGTGTPVVYADSSDTIDHLDLSPDGRHVTYWRLVGTTQQVVILDTQAVPPAVVASDSAADLILGDQRPIDENGNVVYSKVVGTEHQLFRLAPGGSPVSLDVAGVEELEASVSADGSLVAFVGKGAGGVRNVWAGTSQVTFNADPALSTSSVAVSPDGSWIAFHSEADLTSQNPDRTWEVFRVTPDGATLEQVSSVTPAPSGDVLLDRVAPSGDGQVLFWGQTTCPGLCTAIDDNALSLHVASPDEAVPTVVPVNEVVRPPFDVVDDVGGIAPAPGCTVAGLDVTCTAILRASPDATRSLLVQPEWLFDDAGMGTCPVTVLVDSPLVVKLGAGEQLAVSRTLRPACSMFFLNYRVRAVGGELDGQPDFSLYTGPSLHL